MDRITKDKAQQGEIMEAKDVIAGYMDKASLTSALETLKTGEKMASKAKVGTALDIGLGALSAEQDISKSFKDGKFEIAGDNLLQKAGNLASVGAALTETAGLVDPMLMPVGVGLELASDVLNFFGDKEHTNKELSSAQKNTKTITPEQPKTIPAFHPVGHINLMNNNILNKAIS